MKLKNTTSNKILLLGGVVAAFTTAGYFMGKKQGDHKTLAIAGAFIGFLVYGGIASWVIEPNPSKK